MGKGKLVIVVQFLGFLLALELSSGKLPLGRSRLKVTSLQAGSDVPEIGSPSNRLESPSQYCPGCFGLQCCGRCLGWSVGSVFFNTQIPSADASHRHPDRCVSVGTIFKAPILLFPWQAVILRRFISWWLWTGTRSHWVKIALLSCRRSLIIAGHMSLTGGPLLMVGSFWSKEDEPHLLFHICETFLL